MTCIKKLVAGLLLLILPLINLGIGERSQQAQADEPVQPVALRWKLGKGMALEADISIDRNLEIKVMGQDMQQQQTQLFRFRWMVQGRDKNNNWLLSQKVERYQMLIAVGGNLLQGAQLVQWVQFRQAFLGSEFTVSLSPELKIVKIEGRDQLANRLARIDPQLKPWFERCFSEDLHQQTVEAVFAETSPRDVTTGDSWTRSTRMDAGSLGRFQTKHQSTYVGRRGSLDWIIEELAVQTQWPPAHAAEGFPFHIRKNDLKSSSESSAVLRFDRERGRLVSSDTYLDLEGTLVIEIGGMETEVQLQQTQKTVVKLTEVPTAMK